MSPHTCTHWRAHVHLHIQCMRARARGARGARAREPRAPQTSFHASSPPLAPCQGCFRSMNQITLMAPKCCQPPDSLRQRGLERALLRRTNGGVSGARARARVAQPLEPSSMERRCSAALDSPSLCFRVRPARQLLELSKSFLDPFGNEGYPGQNIRVDVLVSELNFGAASRWVRAGQALPDQRMRQ